MKAPFATALAIAVGLIVLLGYFVRLGVLASLRALLLDWAIVVAAVALLLGIINLAVVHWRKMVAERADSVYSAVLLAALGVTLIVVGIFGPAHPLSLWLFNNIQVPVEGSLMAILAVFLTVSAARLLHRRSDPLSIMFFVTVVVVLLASAPLLGREIPGLSEFRAWIAQVPAVGGARGLLLGVALGIVATGLRILSGADRPYGG